MLTFESGTSSPTVYLTAREKKNISSLALERDSSLLHPWHFQDIVERRYKLRFCALAEITEGHLDMIRDCFVRSFVAQWTWTGLSKRTTRTCYRSHGHLRCLSEFQDFQPWAVDCFYKHLVLWQPSNIQKKHHFGGPHGSSDSIPLWCDIASDSRLAFALFGLNTFSHNLQTSWNLHRCIAIHDRKLHIPGHLRIQIYSGVTFDVGDSTVLSPFCHSPI